MLQQSLGVYLDPAIASLYSQTLSSKLQIDAAHTMTEYPGGDRSQYTSFIVTIWYRPLEILFGHPDYGCKVDIWSFGCILTEMMIRKVLVHEKHDISLIMVIPQLSTNPPGGACRRFQTTTRSTPTSRATRHAAASLAPTSYPSSPAQRSSHALRSGRPRYISCAMSRLICSPAHPDFAPGEVGAI